MAISGVRTLELRSHRSEVVLHRGVAATCVLDDAQLVLGSLPLESGKLFSSSQCLPFYLCLRARLRLSIPFNYTGTVSSGTVNGVDVSGDAFSLTAVGDTSTVSSPATDDLSINPVTATFTVGALNGTISVPATSWVLNTLIGLVGLSTTTSVFWILSPTRPRIRPRSTTGTRFQTLDRSTPLRSSRTEAFRAPSDPST